MKLVNFTFTFQNVGSMLPTKLQICVKFPTKLKRNVERGHPQYWDIRLIHLQDAVAYWFLLIYCQNISHTTAAWEETLMV